MKTHNLIILRLARSVDRLANATVDHIFRDEESESEAAEEEVAETRGELAGLGEEVADMAESPGSASSSDPEGKKAVEDWE